MDGFAFYVWVNPLFVKVTFRERTEQQCIKNCCICHHIYVKLVHHFDVCFPRTFFCRKYFIKYTSLNLNVHLGIYFSSTRYILHLIHAFARNVWKLIISQYFKFNSSYYFIFNTNGLWNFPLYSAYMLGEEGRRGPH